MPVSARPPSPVRGFMVRAAALWAAVASGQLFDEEEARRFASLSSVAYCDALEQVQNWTCVPCADAKTRLVPGRVRIVDGGWRHTTRIIVGKLQDQRGCVMAFRGSDDLENWIQDLQFWEVNPTTFPECAGCEVHSGFYEIWRRVRDLATAALGEVGCAPNGTDSEVYVTGHSMGAALAHMAMFTLLGAGYRVRVTYSFEAPRVGNKAFSAAFSGLFPRHVPVFRVTHDRDPVPHLPPRAIGGYTHVQTEVYYDPAGRHRVCPLLEDPSCANSHRDLLAMLLLHSVDHCRSPLVPNGDICNPPGCEPGGALLV